MKKIYRVEELCVRVVVEDFSIDDKSSTFESKEIESRVLWMLITKIIRSLSREERELIIACDNSESKDLLERRDSIIACDWCVA